MLEGNLNLDGGRLFYRVSGKGDPVILIHGNFYRKWLNR